MDNKKLNEKELEQVNGGQAVLPLLSSEAPEVVGAVNPQEHNIMLTGILPEDVDTDRGSFDFEKAKDGRIL